MVTLPEDDEVPSRLVGGNFMTLLYMTQLAVISQDPWFSRVLSTNLVDYVALDLDPMPGVPFEQVVQVALHCRDVLEELSIHAWSENVGLLWSSYLHPDETEDHL